MVVVCSIGEMSGGLVCALTFVCIVLLNVINCCKFVDILLPRVLMYAAVRDVDCLGTTRTVRVSHSRNVLFLPNFAFWACVHFYVGYM